jgi:hypothetical protein
MEQAQALGTGGLMRGEQVVRTHDATTHVEDDLSFAAALPFAITAGVGLWIAILWALARFVF